MYKLLKKVGMVIIAIIVLTGCQKDINVDSQKEDQEMENSDSVQNEEEKVSDELINDVNDDKKEENEVIKDKGNNQEENILEANLDEHDSVLFEIANGWTNGNMFDCTWREGNITFENGIMKLRIDDDGANASPKWSGAEYRSRKFYHYGLFEVRMKPIKNNGVVSSFFIYTGPSDNNPWDEIDIEFLGKDTTKIQFNYFTNGQGNHEFVYDLGFDASEEFHTYAFEWLPDSITWYVDGEAVHTATENIPITPGKVMMNVWPGTGVDAWLNPFDGNVPLTAEYDWFRITQYNMN